MAYTLETRDQVFNMLFLKIHKTIVDGVLPFHPMLSTIRTPTHNLVKIFVPFLEPLTSSNYTIKDSFLFCEEVKKFNSNFPMAKFDVESLFTNILLHEMINLSVQKLSHDKNNINGLSKDSFREILTVTMTGCFVLYDNECLKQHNGVSTLPT